MVVKMLCILVISLCCYGQSNAQEQKSEKDSIRYSAIEKFSQKRKFTKFLHQLIFKPVAKPHSPNSTTQKSIAKKQKTDRKLEGKIVRNIYITTLDPFGYSLKDTTIQPEGFIKNAVNELHMKTRSMVIKDLLLFNKNAPYDSLLIKESERLIRSQKYVQDVMVSTFTTSPKADSVDVFIRVSDVWSIIPSLSASASNLELGLTDINFIGLGNSLHVDTRMNTSIHGNVTQIGYLVPNFKNSHITGNIQYYFAGNNDLIANKEFARPLYIPVSSNLQSLTLGNSYLVKSVELARSFYSPLTVWAGGVYIGQLITNQNYVQNDSLRYLSSKTNIQDYWAARSWRIYGGSSISARTTNFILSVRMLKTRYPGRTTEAETVNIFNKENIYFAGIGITSREFIQDKYVFNYGKTEDIPVGRAFGLTIGTSVRPTTNLYLGLKAAWGNYYPFGYLSSHFEYGTFIGKEGLQQQVITGRINYYTKLFTVGYWKIRQFIRPTVIVGLNRLPTDNLSLNEVMKGFEDLKYPATQMMALSLQTQSYAPWEFYGFRFGPYLFSSFGMLGNTSSGISNSRLYSELGLGVLIKNNYLMINTFQISLSFYPYLPGQGANILNTNAYKTSDYGFNDFEISKPKVVEYR
ncbi:MAG TPA: hypothetical protein DCL77_16895 [Prolixibacteraceae bacterium]|jgi:hypothetical protein|nr:hypothetical protein [Prolixibacteraceae bacterium]